MPFSAKETGVPVGIIARTVAGLAQGMGMDITAEQVGLFLNANPESISETFKVRCVTFPDSDSGLRCAPNALRNPDERLDDLR